MLYIDERTMESLKDIKQGDTSLFLQTVRAAAKYDIFAITHELVASLLPKRPRVSHKGTYGRAMHICGSYGMAGAAVIAAKASYLSGVGIVDCILPDSIYPIVSTGVPEAVFCPLPLCKTVEPKFMDIISERLSKADALLLGCGLSLNESTQAAAESILKNALCPMVIDADGINCVATSIKILEQTASDRVVTPHFGEMSRLTKMSTEAIMNDFITIAADFAVSNKTFVILKGAYTVIASPDKSVYVNLFHGNSGMAVAGSGDMLAGMVVSFIAQGMSIKDAAISAVYIHSLAGDAAAEQGSQRSVTPTQMLECLPRLFKKFE